MSKLIEPVGRLVLERAEPLSGARLLEVGTGNGRNVAITAAARGAQVTGSDITPELLAQARSLVDTAASRSSGSRPTRSSFRSRTRASTG